MGYVALSRVRSLASLTLGGLNRTALTMHEEAYNLDDILRRASVKHAKIHEKLEENYLSGKEKRDESLKKATSKSSGDWQAKIDKMRESYPNAYKPWKKIEDETMLNQWAAGKTVKQLSKLLGRHEGSIRARLKKHFGDAIFQK
jgi:hypothetical protein